MLDLDTLELNKIWMIESGLDFEGSIKKYGEKIIQYATEKGYSIEMRIPHGKFLIVRLTEGNGNPTKNYFMRDFLP
jgi:hypothetical protein